MDSSQEEPEEQAVAAKENKPKTKKGLIVDKTEKPKIKKELVVGKFEKPLKKKVKAGIPEQHLPGRSFLEIDTECMSEDLSDSD